MVRVPLGSLAEGAVLKCGAGTGFRVDLLGGRVA